VDNVKYLIAQGNTRYDIINSVLLQVSKKNYRGNLEIKKGIFIYLRGYVGNTIKDGGYKLYEPFLIRKQLVFVFF
jgi:hypothetical protein